MSRGEERGGGRGREMISGKMESRRAAFFFLKARGNGGGWGYELSMGVLLLWVCI